MSNKRYALITGGSEGIGFEISKLFARDGINLILVSRNKDKLERSKKELMDSNVNIDVLTLSLDLSQLDSAEKLHSFIKEKELDISFLINNAGFGVDGNFADQDAKDIESLINIHIQTVTKICNMFIPNLEKNKGHIMNVSSIAAFQPVPTLNVYAACKVFLYNFTLALRSELKDKGIKVSVLCPPVTTTKFYSTDTMHGLRGFAAWTFTPEFVAIKAYRGIRMGKAVILPGISTWIYCTFIVKVIPWRLIM
jgi:short-subunit dehydrogenase